MSQGRYIICPKCQSANVELVLMGTKKKIDWSVLWNKYSSGTKLVREQKRHCKSCGYLW